MRNDLQHQYLNPLKLEPVFSSRVLSFFVFFMGFAFLVSLTGCLSPVANGSSSKKTVYSCTDSTLTAANVCSGVTIADITGTAGCVGAGTGVTDAGAGDVLAGTEFWTSAGTRTTGTMTDQGTWDLRTAFPGTGKYSGTSNAPAAGKYCSDTTILGTSGTIDCSFTPESISGLRLWADADTFDAAFNHGDTINTAWVDSSAQGNDLSVNGSPTFEVSGGKNYVKISQADYFSIAAGSLTLATDYTVFAVGRIPAGCAGAGGTFTLGGDLAFSFGSSGNTRFLSVGGSITGPVFTPNDSVEILGATVSNAGNDTLYAGGGMAIVAAAGSSDLNGVRIQNVFVCTLSVGQVIIYDKVISTSERALLLKYLTEQYL